MENQKWYAVLDGNDDNDWGNGSFDLGESIAQCKARRELGYTDAYIAVIDDDGEDPICVAEIRDI